MTALLGKFTKQTAEILDYDVDFTDWFDGRQDAPAAISPLEVVAETGITVVSSTMSGLVAKVVLSGGTNGTKYKITVRLTTSLGLVKEGDFTVTIKDI